MSYRLTKIYTRKGDEGHTTFSDRPISKDDLLIDVIGTIDELNSMIGLVIANGMQNQTIATVLLQIQNDLFDLGGELHSPERVAITADKITRLEKELDEWNHTLPPLKEFLLPGGNKTSATCHVARTVCRRAERLLVKLHHQVPLTNPEMLRYLNRLSDLLFVAARMLARETAEDEKMWEK